MASFLPPLYPDELLYSLLARIHWLTGSESPKRTLDELFGSRYVRAGVALQANLSSLCTQFPAERKVTPEMLARNATLFPYLTAFQPKDVQDWTLATLSEGNAEGVHVRLGLVAGVVRLPKCLRYCPACRSAMLSMPGEFYWMRAHQLSGVLVCPLHRGVPLADSTVYPAEANRHEYVAADEINCPPNPPCPSWSRDTETIRLLNEIAEASVALMTNPPQARDCEAWAEHYRAALMMRGFRKGVSSMDQKSLLDAYMAHFRPIFSILPEATPDLWLEGMTRKHRKAIAPLRHILLRLLIDVLPLSGKSAPFGCGPWPCRNPLADHCGQSVVADCCTHKEGGKIIGVFDCSCGYIFSRAADPGSKVRILNLSPLFSEKLRELLTFGAGLRATARTLHVDTNTVRLHVSKLGLASPWKPRSQRPKVPVRDRDSARRSWTKARRKAPNLSRKELRSKFPAEYAWLYRHDRDWLESQPPHPKHSKGGKPRRNWPSIDQKIARELREGVARLRGERLPLPITRASLERLLGRPDWFYTRLNKLPFCAAAFEELIEPVEAFQCRRIAWAVDELHRLGKPVTVWRLRRMAGLHDCCAPEVEAALSAAEERPQ